MRTTAWCPLQREQHGQQRDLEQDLLQQAEGQLGRSSITVTAASSVGLHVATTAERRMTSGCCSLPGLAAPRGGQSGSWRLASQTGCAAAGWGSGSGARWTVRGRACRGHQNAGPSIVERAGISTGAMM